MFVSQRARTGSCFIRRHLEHRVARSAPIVLGGALLGAACSGEAGDLFPRMSGLGGAVSEVRTSDTDVSDTGVSDSASGGAGLAPSLGAGGAEPSASAGGTPGAPLGSSQGGGGSGPAPLAENGQGLGAGGAGESLEEPAPACDPCPCGAGPFGEPELVLGLGLGLPSFGPAPAADGLTLLFSAIGESEDIYRATRTDRSARFSAAAPVPGLNQSSTDEGTPFLTADGGSVYFFSTRPGDGTVGDRDLWQAAAEGEGFTEPAVVPRVNDADLDHLPRLTADGLQLLFVSGRAGSALASNLWVASRPSLDAPFGEPTELPGVNTDAREEGFWLSDDGLTLYFASNRVPGSDMDIFVAVRPDRQSPFEPAQELAVVNTPGIELDPALTADGFELFFASDRSGTMQLYRSARVCP